MGSGRAARGPFAAAPAVSQAPGQRAGPRRCQHWEVLGTSGEGLLTMSPACLVCFLGCLKGVVPVFLTIKKNPVPRSELSKMKLVLSLKYRTNMPEIIKNLSKSQFLKVGRQMPAMSSWARRAKWLPAWTPKTDGSRAAGRWDSPAAVCCPLAGRRAWGSEG